ncbi:hypothetical protein J1N35_001242 [Gossypium stocksii]|uniref:Uncharacterized protein n=1 Tax=Gossypium stocksii TaxID=47602 RepID=A0A9D3WIJ2_9ROSI|nr:hypothetical protein J1N35_001242 [Gossypium stocksii]
MVVKLDIYTDYARRGHFARLVVCVDLRKPLVSKVEEEPFGLWMLVERPQRGKGCFSGAARKEDFGGSYGGSRFATFRGDAGEIHGVIHKEKDGVGYGGDKSVSFGMDNGGKMLNRWQTKGKEAMIGFGLRKGFKTMKPTNGKLGFKVTKDHVAFDGGSKMGPKMDVGHEEKLSVQPVSVPSNLNKDRHKHDKPPDIVASRLWNDNMDLEVAMERLVRSLEQGPNGTYKEDDDSSEEEVIDAESNCRDKVSC